MANRDALIGSFNCRVSWLVELLIDFEEDEPAKLRLVAALRGPG